MSPRGAQHSFLRETKRSAKEVLDDLADGPILYELRGLGEATTIRF